MIGLLYMAFTTRGDCDREKRYFGSESAHVTPNNAGTWQNWLLPWVLQRSEQKSSTELVYMIITSNFNTKCLGLMFRLKKVRRFKSCDCDI